MQLHQHDLLHSPLQVRSLLNPDGMVDASNRVIKREKEEFIVIIPVTISSSVILFRLSTETVPVCTQLCRYY